jgi:hypothetical protein
MKLGNWIGIEAMGNDVPETIFLICISNSKGCEFGYNWNDRPAGMGKDGSPEHQRKIGTIFPCMGQGISA